MGLPVDFQSTVIFESFVCGRKMGYLYDPLVLRSFNNQGLSFYFSRSLKNVYQLKSEYTKTGQFHCIMNLKPQPHPISIVYKTTLTNSHFRNKFSIHSFTHATKITQTHPSYSFRHHSSPFTEI